MLYLCGIYSFLWWPFQTLTDGLILGQIWTKFVRLYQLLPNCTDRFSLMNFLKWKQKLKKNTLPWGKEVYYSNRYSIIYRLHVYTVFSILSTFKTTIALYRWSLQILSFQEIWRQKLLSNILLGLHSWEILWNINRRKMPTTHQVTSLCWSRGFVASFSMSPRIARGDFHTDLHTLLQYYILCVRPWKCLRTPNILEDLEHLFLSWKMGKTTVYIKSVLIGILLWKVMYI